MGLAQLQAYNDIIESMREKLTWLVLNYLRYFSTIRLQKDTPRIIGVAGSSGKSSLVSLLSIVLKQKYKIKQTGGKNSEIGLPLHILDLQVGNNSLLQWIKIAFLVPYKAFFAEKNYDIYIAEMGIDSPDEPKNMSYLLKIIQPEVGIVTNVGLEHSMYFDTKAKGKTATEKTEQILAMTAEQETLLLRTLPRNGTAVINVDNEYINSTLNKINAKKITISTQNKYADLFAYKISSSLTQFSLDMVWKGKTYHLQLKQVLPALYAYEFLFAIATGLIFDIPISQSITAIEKYFALPPGRCSIFPGIKNTILIDSSYNNATREPILGMLDMMREIGFNRRKLAIIGDMRELGSQSKEVHEEVARKILTTVNTAILIGPLMREYVVPILKKRKFHYQSFVTVTEAKEAILTSIQPKDLILIKGSQNTLFLERVVEMLLEDKNDVKNLCRRGSFWNAKRAATL